MFRLPFIPQQELANLLNISQRTYSKIESGEIGVKIKRLQKIASYLNVEITELLGSVLNDFETIKVESSSIIDRERDLYEKRILQQEKQIEYLQGLVNFFRV
jgi:transcriptional regulator with XRE-family HTH domain